MMPVDDTVDVFKSVKVAYDRFLVAEEEHKDSPIQVSCSFALILAFRSGLKMFFTLSRLKGS